MKKVLLAAVAALLPVVASAAPSTSEMAALTAYATKAFPRCVDGAVALQPMAAGGPKGFTVYSAVLKSTDTNCSKQAYLLYSPNSQQIIVGTVFALPPEGASTTDRAAAEATKLLKEPVTATYSGFPMMDGLKPIAITKQTAFGPFSYHGYIDGSEQFLIIGVRGMLGVDPGKTLVDALGLQNAVHRGNLLSKVQIIELSDFQCPTCGRAHKTIEPFVAKHLDRVSYYRLDLPLFEHHEWSLYAALGARAIQRVSPKKYVAYTNFVFSNQETIGTEKFDTVLKNFCDDNEIDWKAVEKIYHSPQEKAALMDQVARAFDSGIVSTPTYIINGQMLGYGPEGKFTFDSLKKAIGGK